ncbi:MAG: molecular chaperone HtpG [Oscillospiraceae bacterium]|nr:molecular chaperone HtpG [Oscillospiraceae bacterium]
MAKRQFKAESKRLMELMINSIYTHREIFLREIISNASDAMDKRAYQALTDDAVQLDRADLKIMVSIDKEARTITVSDTGIGMTKDALADNLGVIAKSGSLAFKSDMEDAEDIDIIGQFGVGFYSAFMVADEVTVTTKAYGETEAHQWVSTGADGYSISVCEKETVGTDVVIHLRKDSPDELYSDYLEPAKLRGIIKKYSDYIRYPIVFEGETVNSMIPIWQRAKSEASDEDCFAFYKEKFHDFNEPIAVQRVSAEGTAVSYRALLFYPGKTPYNYYTKDYEAGLQLYTAGVLIMEHCQALLPEHFRFVRGVVDSSDLSLNISRETLQQDRQVRTIAASLEKKIKSELGRLKDNEPERYEPFYQSFGLQLKYGVVADFGAKKDLLADLLLFHSAKTGKLISLQAYVDAMPEEQKYIYFAPGETTAKIAARPQLEIVLDAGYDVFYMTDDVDEFVVQELQTFGEKPFRSVYDDDLGLASEEAQKQETESLEELHADLLAFMAESLNEKVHAVRLTHKLKSHPACIGTQGAVSLEMEKYFANVAQHQNIEPLRAERVLELNPNHPIFERIKHVHEIDPARAAKYVELVHYLAMLMADLPVEDLAAYAELSLSLLLE